MHPHLTQILALEAQRDRIARADRDRAGARPRGRTRRASLASLPAAPAAAVPSEAGTAPTP